MAKKKNKFNGMKEADLKKELAKLQEEIRLGRFTKEGSKSKNVKETSFKRKQIARILTELNKNNNK